MPELFVNEGFGWECLRCRASEGSEQNGAAEVEEPGRASESSEPVSGARTLARFFREGEAEGGGPRLASAARARWKDDARRVLRCERCGAEENV
ncbi:MAG TPA: hypothetical protein VJ866_06245 [Pyrinomonadaceae bacterium]|nr:hypothetical protein [Pyrinomonadaceae bacterium]